MKWIPSRFSFMLLLIFLSCKSVGPKVIPEDQFNFNSSISTASNEQLLVNLIRLRYLESPVFLKVSSVINQYTRSGGVNAQAGLNNAIPTGANSAIASGNLAWSNTPTITYIPISGREFSTNLLLPIPPGSLINMVQAGWPIDLVLSLGVFSINGLKDDVARPSVRREANTEFSELIDLWQKLSHAGILGTRRTEQDLLFFRENYPSQYRASVLRFKSLLELDPDLSEFPIEYGRVQRNNGEIRILSGSIWEIMLNLSWQFNVPEEHVASGRTAEAFRPLNRQKAPPLDLRFSKEKPENAFISVFQQGYWFYIDADDRLSKRNFSFLQLLLNLAESTPISQGPMVTVPTN
jgi:hypothetical protein